MELLGSVVTVRLICSLRFEATTAKYLAVELQEGDILKTMALRASIPMGLQASRGPDQ